MEPFDPRLERKEPRAGSLAAHRAVGRCLQLGVALGTLAFARVGIAQPRQGMRVCLPGTTVCGWADGQGGIRIDASGAGQVAPSAADASGQVNASGQAAGQANGTGTANANGQANGNEKANENGGGNANASPPATEPPSPAYSTGEPPTNPGYTGRFGVGASGCFAVRASIWSGYKAGGCVAVSFRFEGLTFEMETQLLYGGTTRAFDWTFPISFVIPLANDKSLFEGGYLRFGGSPIGATFGREQDGGNFVRFGLLAGAGYEILISDSVSWRVIDARVSFEMGTQRAMDRLGNWVDLGLQVGSGLIL